MRERVGHLEEAYWVSDWRACRVIGIYRSSHRYRSHRRDDRALRLRIVEITETRVRYGYRRFHVLLRREGWRVNYKRPYRIYCQEGLSLRRKRPRRHFTGSRRMARPEVQRPNACWSMDFVVDSLFNGHRFRTLTVVDIYSRECLAIEVGQSMTGEEVAAIIGLGRLAKGTRRSGSHPMRQRKRIYFKSSGQVQEQHKKPKNSIFGWTSFQVRPPIFAAAEHDGVADGSDIIRDGLLGKATKLRVLVG
jgi:transposase InsO family protein